MLEYFKKFWNMICDFFANAKFNLIDRRKNAPKLVTGDIPSEQIRHAIRLETNEKCKFYLTDRKYQLTSVEDVKRILALDDTDRKRYVAEYHDCDDFAYRLMGQFSTPEWAKFAFGIMFTVTPAGGHAVNCMVDNELSFWVIEPQNDRVFKLPEDWTPYIVLM